MVLKQKYLVIKVVEGGGKMFFIVCKKLKSLKKVLKFTRFFPSLYVSKFPVLMSLYFLSLKDLLIVINVFKN